MKYRPRILWRIGIALAPAWLLTAIVIFDTVKSITVETIFVEVPEIKQMQQQQNDTVNTLPLSAYACLWNTELRHSLQEAPEKQKPKIHIKHQPLNIELIGTAFENHNSYALLKTKTGAISLLKTGSLFETFQIDHITPSSVILKSPDTTKRLRLPESLRNVVPAEILEVAQISTSGPDAEQIQPHETDAQETQDTNEATTQKQIINLNLPSINSASFLSQVRLVPVTGSTASSSGFRIDSIAQQSPLLKAGLRPGDLICAVDDQPLRNTKDIKIIYASLNDQKNHIWELRREKSTIYAHLRK